MENSASKRCGIRGTKLRYPVRNDVSDALAYFTPGGHDFPKYFWGMDWNQKGGFQAQPTYRGYKEARLLVGAGSWEDLEVTIRNGLNAINEIYAVLDSNLEMMSLNCNSRQLGGKCPENCDNLDIVDVRLSDDLSAWKTEQHNQGHVLPGKGLGLRRASDEVIQLLGIEHWPAPLLTHNVLFGTGWTNLLIGAYDSRTLYSNCCCDIGFFYEHGYHKVFPEFEKMIYRSASDDEARSTPLGAERRNAADRGLTYIRGKANLETKYVAELAGRTAKLDRMTAHIICFCEASLAGTACEAIGRGYDPAAVFDDMVFSAPATDVVDVGSDLCNSEIMNSFLNTADITATGDVTEETLRRVYDAYAAIGARCLTERWMEPLANMNAMVYVWHILNDRHYFLRRTVLGFNKVRKDEDKRGQREGDFDEVFDKDYRTTGFSRPLETACDGSDACDAVKNLLEKVPTIETEFLRELWTCLVDSPLNYARAGVVDLAREEDIVQCLSTTLAKAYHDGLIREQQWLIAHACHHAWQVNYLMEAAMFGSLLDDRSLSGALDRAN